MIRHSRLTALGILLCVLAALFAIEAKIAWFSPAGSATAQISFDKARPAEPSKALPHHVDAPAAPAHDFSGSLALLSAMLLLAVAAFFTERPTPFRTRSSSFPAFFPLLFFRPPPVL